MLNLFGFFDQSIPKTKGAKLEAMDTLRCQSPNTAKMIKIDQKYGGKPKKEQMVREGHYPKFSEMIDQIEQIALQYVNFEGYL